jgi:hypothetical protein
MTSYPPALHHSIVAFDVAEFTDPKRRGIPQLGVRDGLYSVLERSFDQAGIGWSTSPLREDRGDGILMLVPATVAKIRLVDDLPLRLVAELRRYNADRSAVGAIRLRLAVHAGDVRRDGNGMAGPAVDFTCRMLDAQPLRDMLATSGGSLALVVSNVFYDDVIAVDPAARPDAFQRIPVAVKSLDTTAWARVFDGGVEPSGPRPGALPQMAPALEDRPARDEEFFDVVDALVEVPSMRDEASRRLVLDLLRPELADEVPYDPRTRPQVVALLRVCLRFEDGVADLLTTIRRVDGDALPVRRFEAIARKWLANHPG